MKSKYFFLGIFVFLLFWYGISFFGIVDSFFLPNPLDVFLEMGELLFSNSIIPDFIATIERVVISFLIALVLGVPLGLLLGSSKELYNSCEFIIDFMRSLPATALFPLFMIVLGIGNESRIGVAAFGALLIIVFNTAHGVRHLNKYRMRAIKLMGAGRLEIFKLVSFWETLPQIFAGSRIAISIALVIVIVTEMFIGTQFGLGRRIVDFQYIYNIKGMYAMIIYTGILGYALNYVFSYIEKRIIHWTGN